MENQETSSEPQDLCPLCSQPGSRVEFVEESEPEVIRGEVIHVKWSYHRCIGGCGQEFGRDEEFESLEEAHRLYREKHGMVQPEAIIAWRETAQLSQAQLAARLHISEKTVARYENGALQDEEHDAAIRKLMTAAA